MTNDYDFNDYFRLVHSFLALLFHALAVYLFVDTARRVFTSAYGEMSPLLKLLLLLWIVEGVLSFPYSATIPLWWITQTRTVLTDEWFFWAVIFERSLSCSIPAAVFFLTVDRCFTLLFGLGHKRVYKMMICALCALVVAISAGTCLYLYLVSWIHSFYDVGLVTTGCMSTVCVLESADDWQFLVRVTFGTLNFACSLCFYLVLKRYNRKAFAHASSGKSKSASNSFVIYAVASELLLNFVPHAGCLAYELAFQHNISDWFGTYSRLLTAIDAITCAVMYRRVRKSLVAQAFAQTPSASIPRRKKSVNVVTPVRPTST